MFDGLKGEIETLADDRDQLAIRRLMKGLTGDEIDLPEHVILNLRDAAVMALFHGRRMKLQSQDAFDALAALCLVLGDRRSGFFENIFVKRMMSNGQLTSREKLHRLIEIIIGTTPRPARCLSNDTVRLETA